MLGVVSLRSRHATATDALARRARYHYAVQTTRAQTRLAVAVLYLRSRHVRHASAACPTEGHERCPHRVEAGRSTSCVAARGRAARQPRSRSGCERRDPVVTPTPKRVAVHRRCGHATRLLVQLRRLCAQQHIHTWSVPRTSSVPRCDDDAQARTIPRGNELLDAHAHGGGSSSSVAQVSL